MIGRKMQGKHRRAFVDELGLPEDKCHFDGGGSFREVSRDQVSGMDRIRLVSNVECRKPVGEEIWKKAGKGERDQGKIMGKFVERCLIVDDGKRGRAEDLKGEAMEWIVGKKEKETKKL